MAVEPRLTQEFLWRDISNTRGFHRCGFTTNSTATPSCGVQLVVHRTPPVVHLYDVVEFGRRFHRTLVFTSDAGWCLHDVQPTVAMANPYLLPGPPPSPWSEEGGGLKGPGRGMPSLMVSQPH